MFAKKVPCSVLPPSIARLLAQEGYDSPLEVELLQGGNNQTFRLLGNNYQIVAKIYFQSPADPRDRLGAEFAFTSYLWSRGERDIARPIAQIPEERVAFYSSLGGRKLRAEEIDLNRVGQLIQFFHRINTDNERASHLKPASEACFSMQQHLERISRRVEALRQYPAIADFFSHLTERWSDLRAQLREEPGGSVEACLSPSDFGFHNALLDDQRLFWLDFEYAGWDDPAKTVCDAVCQPALPLPEGAWPLLLEMLQSRFGSSASRRAVKLLPAYQIKWCCILLNEFRPESLARRRFAGQTVDLEAQLGKAQALLAQVRW